MPDGSGGAAMGFSGPSLSRLPLRGCRGAIRRRWRLSIQHRQGDVLRTASELMVPSRRPNAMRDPRSTSKSAAAPAAPSHGGIGSRPVAITAPTTMPPRTIATISYLTENRQHHPQRNVNSSTTRVYSRMIPRRQAKPRANNPDSPSAKCSAHKSGGRAKTRPWLSAEERGAYAGERRHPIQEEFFLQP